MANWSRRKEADWQATHLDSTAWAEGILDGTIDPPSWETSRSDLCRRLRNQGVKTYEERQREKEKSESMLVSWYGDGEDVW